MSGRRELAQLAWPEVEASTLYVPLGSSEQHGPHLSIGTDTAIAVAVARALVIDPGGIVAPEIAYGASGEHEHFPGTVSIGAAALELLILEYGRSAMRWAKRIVIVNGHGGNVRPLSAAVLRLRLEARDVSWLPCAVTTPDQSDSHAGRVETSLMMHLDPDCVRLDRVQAGATGAIGELLPRLQSEGVKAVSPNGVLGDPRGASAASGAVILADVIASARRRLAGAVDRFGCLQEIGS